MKNKEVELERQKRIDLVNEMIKAIGEVGRRFFFNEKNGFAFIWMDERGRLYFRDDYNQRDIYLHYRYFGTRQGFSHGGTLRQLVMQFKEFIMTGKKLFPKTFGKWTSIGSDGDYDMWGYGEAMELVREKARELDILEALPA